MNNWRTIFSWEVTPTEFPSSEHIGWLVRSSTGDNMYGVVVCIGILEKFGETRGVWSLWEWSEETAKQAYQNYREKYGTSLVPNSRTGESDGLTYMAGGYYLLEYIG